MPMERLWIWNRYLNPGGSTPTRYERHPSLETTTALRTGITSPLATSELCELEQMNQSVTAGTSVRVAPDPKTGLLNEEYADVYGIPFSVIPFRGRPTKKAEPEDKPKNHVLALEDRKHMEIRFPVVEGYAFALKRYLIRCDVAKMEPLIVEPSKEPTGTFVRPQVEAGVRLARPTSWAGCAVKRSSRSPSAMPRSRPR